MSAVCYVCHRDIEEVTILDYDGYSICSDCEDQQYEYSGSPEHMAKQAELGHNKDAGDIAIIEWEPKPLPLPIVMPVLPGRHIGWKRDRGTW